MRNGEEPKEVYSFWMGNGSIRYLMGMYFICGVRNNQLESSVHTILLGSSKTEAINSLRDLEQLKKECKGTIEVEGAAGESTRIYKELGVLTFSTEGVAGQTYALFYLNINKAIKAIQKF